MSDIMWWGYLHQNGKIQVKRWFGDHKDYTDDCRGNEFVQKVVPPFSASSREEAIEIIKQQLQKMEDSKTDDRRPGFREPKTGVKYLFIGPHLFPIESGVREIETDERALKVVDLEVDLNEDGSPRCARFRTEGYENTFESHYPWAFIEDTPENNAIFTEFQEERKKLAEQTQKVRDVRKRLATLEDKDQ
jgi:hypothetical protein